MHDVPRYLAAKRATIVNATMNSLLAFFKIILGIIGHSHALVADGIHSFSDLITDAIVLFAAKIGATHPDPEHPYGHRRVETVATVSIALILGGVAIGIAYDALHHIFLSAPTQKPSFLVIIVAAISIFANEFLYHYTLHEGNKIDSDLLRANAWHNRSDALVSMLVLVSVIGAIFGAPYLDSVGALIIALLIFKMSIKMIWNSIKELIDTSVDAQLILEITRYILNIPGVKAIHQLRTRSHGNNIFIDIHIEVNPIISVSEGHYIGEQVTLSLIKNFDRVADVIVHIDPEPDEHFILSKDLPNRKKLEDLLRERWQTIPSYSHIKKIHLHYLKGKLSIEIYFPKSMMDEVNFADYQKMISDINYIGKLFIYWE